MADKVDIFNMSLSNIGVDNDVSDPDEDSREAIACRKYYDTARDATLRDFNWAFAKKYQALALLTDPPSEWLYKYAYPSDCVFARYIVRDVVSLSDPIDLSTVQTTPLLLRRSVQPAISFQIANLGTGNQRVILTDQEDAVLAYTMRVENENLYDPMFVEALCAKLGSFICRPLSISAKTRDEMTAHYRNLIAMANERNLNEGQGESNLPSEFVLARTS